MYAIVDIETTGGHASGNRIIEVAILLFDGEKITDRYESFINPECRIPGFITSLTGISDDMVESAPTFRQVSKEIQEFTRDRIFVAHNVNFDYTFFKQEFGALGIKYDRSKLCTVRVSRKVFPKLPSYSLGNLCGSLGIKIKNRHRAGGDAEATVSLLKLCLDNDKENFISTSLKKNSRETLLPANLPREQFDALPNEPGVYYFHDHNGKVLYVGKAKDIKKRVVSHFSGKTTVRSQVYMKDVYGVSFELCGNELISLLKESDEIKKYWPSLNSSQKKVSNLFGIYQYEDMQGYIRFSIGNIIKNHKPVMTFRYFNEAREMLQTKVAEYNLCPKLSGLVTVKGACFAHNLQECNGACINEETVLDYNYKVTKSMQSFEEQKKTYVVKGKGRRQDEYSVILVEAGKYVGFGFVENDTQISDIEELKTYVTGYKDNSDVQKILAYYVKKASPGSLITF